MKILVVGPAWIGDMVMAHALFKLLKQRHLDSEIHVLAPEWSRSVLCRIAEVDQVINSPFAHGELRLRDRYRLGVSLRKQKYDQAIVLPYTYKSALIPFFAKIPRRIGWVGESRYGILNDIRRLDKRRLPLMVERYIALGLEKNEPLPSQWFETLSPRLKISAESVTQTLNRFSLKKSKEPILVLCPGAAAGPAKRWPATYYAEIAKAKLAEGWRVWLLGAEKDKEFTDFIFKETHFQAENLGGITKLDEAIDLLSLADLVVTNDSGLMHVAASLDRPVIAIYGPTSPEHAPPLSTQGKTLKSTLSCSPCLKHICPYGHQRCMKELKPAQVLEMMPYSNLKEGT